MMRPSSALLAIGFSVAALAPMPTLAADLPEIKTSASNTVPQCATPGRLMAFLESRNKHLDPKFSSVATEYMRQGEALGLRWDIAFFQMMIETGNLSFGGDVKPGQNNFAGLGATGGGVSGESFKDVSTGVLAHLQHVLLYSGARIDNPVAERTRKVQDWNVIGSWYKDVKGPRTYGHLSKRWAPGSAAYPRDIAAITDAFYKSVCPGADPRPELVQEARGGRSREAPPAVAVLEPEPSPPAAPETSAAPPAEPVSEKAPAGTAESRAPAATAAVEETKETPKPSFKILNEQKAEPTPDVAATSSSEGAAPPPATGAEFQTAGAAAAARQNPGSPPAGTPAPSPCRVWTASYGGSKAIIIKATAEKTVNYTVLDVNDGKEKREADAYIAAYAKGGETVGEFASQTQALDKAFELCPEG